MDTEKTFLKLFMEKLAFPNEAISAFNFLESELINYCKLEKLVNDFMNKTINIEPVLEELDIMASDLKLSNYTLHFYFYMKCSYILYNRYISNNISEEIYWNTVSDLKCKLMECYELYGVWGTFVGTWFPRFFDMSRFAIGRFQYETIDFPYDLYEKEGVTVKKGDKVFNIHIPSCGPISKTVRMDSYRRAYKFFENQLNGKPMVIVCYSWLLYPEHEKFLPKNSNILDFKHDFEIINSEESDIFNDAWRVFGKDYKLPPEKLPQKTSLQKAYAQRLIRHEKTGTGYGIFIFYSDKIL